MGTEESAVVRLSAVRSLSFWLGKAVYATVLATVFLVVPSWLLSLHFHNFLPLYLAGGGAAAFLGGCILLGPGGVHPGQRPGRADSVLREHALVGQEAEAQAHPLAEVSSVAGFLAAAHGQPRRPGSLGGPVAAGGAR
jgi:hypothetical protein